MVEEENKSFDASQMHLAGLSQQGKPSEFFENWFELRLAKTTPERRSYHSSFVYDNKLYVLGGLDIREGSLGSLWELDLNNLRDLEMDEIERRHSCGWVPVKMQGNAINKPNKIAYHTSVVYRESMFMFGGAITRSSL